MEEGRNGGLNIKCGFEFTLGKPPFLPSSPTYKVPCHPEFIHKKPNSLVLQNANLWRNEGSQRAKQNY
jgi:hypothetical protein